MPIVYCGCERGSSSAEDLSAQISMQELFRGGYIPVYSNKPRVYEAGETIINGILGIFMLLTLPT